jgi:MraZ protein
MQDWLNVEEQLMKLSNMNRRSRNVQRLLLGHASECELDNQGRIRIAAPLREYAGLDKKVVLVGQLNKFELWDADTWQTERDAWITEAQSNDMEIDDALSQVSI